MKLLALGVDRVGLRNFAGTGAADLTDELVAIPFRLTLDACRLVFDLFAVRRQAVYVTLA